MERHGQMMWFLQKQMLLVDGNMGLHRFHTHSNKMILIAIHTYFFSINELNLQKFGAGLFLGCHWIFSYHDGSWSRFQYTWLWRRNSCNMKNSTHGCVSVGYSTKTTIFLVRSRTPQSLGQWLGLVYLLNFVS